MSHNRALQLDRLKAGLPGVSPARGAEHAEAGLICLTSQGHITDVELEVKGFFEKILPIVWTDTVTDQMRRSWNDLQEATESGACGIAFLLILELTVYTVIDRSRKGSGVDYHLGYRDVLPFENAARLEVSGILKASDSDIDARVKQKVRQTERADSGALPVYIIVVEFNRPLAYVVKK